MNRQKERFNVRTLERLEVLLIVSSYLPNLGGLQSVTSRLATELRQRGHPVEILAQRYPRTLPALEDIDAVRVQRMLFLTPRLHDLFRGRLGLFVAGFVYFPTTLIRLLWRIARDKPDVINLHFVGAPAFVLLIARTLRRFRFIVSLHGDDVEGLPRGTWFDRWVFRATLRRADAVTACSRYLLNQAEAVEPGIARKAREIYNGTDLDADLTPGFYPKGEEKREVRLLAVGRLVPKKGFDVLLHALAECTRTNCRTRLTVIGDGPERRSLEKLARELVLNGKVEWRGAQDHATVMQAIASAAIMIVPSREEPFGLVALEAMASGKPVVATRVGGLPEVLEGAEAVMVEPNNPLALAQAIEQALARMELEPNYGARNREIAARFSTSQMVDQYEALYLCGEPAV